MLKSMQSAFASQGFVDTVCAALDFAPELKHENLLTTHLSIQFNRSGGGSEREIRKNGRRYDLQFKTELVEAKYHYEGDIAPISTSLVQAKNNPDYLKIQLGKSYQSASKDMLQQAVRVDEKWLIWYVAVRSNNPAISFRVNGIIGNFYKEVGASSLSCAVCAAESKIDIAITEFFALRGSAPISHKMPTIPSKHGALVTRLLQLR